MSQCKKHRFLCNTLGTKRLTRIMILDYERGTIRIVRNKKMELKISEISHSTDIQKRHWVEVQRNKWHICNQKV